MSKNEVWKEAYEIVGDGIAIAEAFYDQRNQQGGALWAVVRQLGAEGYRPSYRGGIQSLYFKEVPPAYRQVGKDKGFVECVPHKGRSGGRELAQAIANAPTVTNESALADAFGWEGRSPLDGYHIYHATATKLELPSVRYLLRLPRQLDDGWVAPPTLNLIPMSEYIRAFEDHNAAVAALKSDAAKAGAQ